MKHLKYYLLFILTVLTAIGCNDAIGTDLSGRPYIHTAKTSYRVNAGAKYIIKTFTDSLGTASKSFRWSVRNPEIADIVAGEGSSGILTAKAPGTTVLKVESEDGSVQYYADLTVSEESYERLLAIGNSFSDDALLYYLHDMASESGHKLLICNLYIGGCSLQRHWENVQNDAPDYILQRINLDGSRDDIKNSRISQTLLDENWDYISLQQVSQESGIYEGYQEYLPKLVDYVKKLSTNPDLKLLLHQTWAYAEDSQHDGFKNYSRDQLKMYHAIMDAVAKAKDLVKADLVIPSGTAIQNGRTSYIPDSRFTRDGYHLSLDLGRYIAACTLYEALYGNVKSIKFKPKGLSEYDARLAREAATQAVAKPFSITKLTEYNQPPRREYTLTAPILIDFGQSPTEAPGVNNFVKPDDHIASLVNRKGDPTDFLMVAVDRPFGSIDRGAMADNSLGLPATVARDCIFADGIKVPFFSFKFSNLDREQEFDIYCYGNIDDRNTQVTYSLTGNRKEKQDLVMDFNKDKMVIFRKVKPSVDGSFLLRAEPGPRNTQWARFYCINAMIIAPAGAPLQ